MPSSSAERRRGRGHNSTRDWAELPLDSILAILHKLDHIDVLTRAGQVCRSWRRAAREEPELWRRIDMRHHANLFDKDDLLGMAQAAVRRSKGQCVAFWGKYDIDDDFLLYLGNQAPYLKSLRLICCYNVSNKGFAEAIKKFLMLEELELSLCNYVFGQEAFETVGKACPQLKHFRLSERSFSTSKHSKYNENGEALAIATMTELRSLQIIGNYLTNKGMTTILHNCPHLESLDIRRCFGVNMNDSLRAKCARIKILRPPNDSTDDYEYESVNPVEVDSGSDSGDHDDILLFGSEDYDD